MPTRKRKKKKHLRFIYTITYLPLEKKTDELRGTLTHLDLMNITMEFIYYLIFQGVHVNLKCHIYKGQKKHICTFK